MKIVNLTRWRTDHIRAIVARVAQDELEAETRKRLLVRVVYRRRSRSGSYCGGHATLGVKGEHGYAASRMTLTLPSLVVSAPSLAKVAAHEMAHLRGLTHRDMGTSARYSYRATGEEGWEAFYAWAREYPIEGKPEATVKVVTRDDKLLHARIMLAKWQRTEKRAAQKVRRWRVKVRYYETTIAKAAQAADQALTPELAANKLTP